MIVSRIHVLNAIAATALVAVNGQTTHTVSVGVSGSFFDPPTLAAGLNDTVTFVFGGDIHTVTQSTFEDPCLPLAGGFNSGLAGRSGNSSAPAPTWDLHITDIVNPIWFFCEATRPSSHCAAGMVGSINPPNQTMYNLFVSAAKQVSGTPTPTISVVLTGQGAFATNSPAVRVTSAPVVTPSPQSSTSSTIPVATTTQSTTTNASTSASTSHLGAIVGGAIGGVLGLLFVAAGLYWLCHVRHQRTGNNHNNTLESPKPFHTREISTNTLLYARPTTSPMRSPSEFGDSKHHGNVDYTNVPSSPPPPTRAVSPDSTMVLAPVRRAETPPNSNSNVISPARGIQHHSSYPTLSRGMPRKPSTASDFLSAPLAPAAAASDQQHASAQLSIQALANEVAAVLLKSPSLGNLHQKQQPQQQQQADVTSGASSSSGSRSGGQRGLYVANSGDVEKDEAALPPPTYRTAMNSPLRQVNFDKER